MAEDYKRRLVVGRSSADRTEKDVKSLRDGTQHSSAFQKRLQDNPSARLVDQRVRSRIMEAVLTLADGSKGVRRVGPDEYFESFYDWIPHRSENREIRANSATTADEVALLLRLSGIVDDACDATCRLEMSAEEFIATEWPERIQPIALVAINLMRRRGCFSEEIEEDEPSISDLK